MPADQVGACAAALKSVHALIEAHVLAADRLHGDDTTMPILARGKTDTGRIWIYVRDDRPFGRQSRPAALFRARRHRHERQARQERRANLFTPYTFKVTDVLGEDEEFRRDYSIGIFSDDGLLSAWDDHPASDFSFSARLPVAR